MREFQSRAFIENKLTSEPNQAVYFNLHWWIPGRLAALFGLTLSQAYQVYRLFSISFLSVVLYLFSGMLFADGAQRRFAYLLSLGSSGLGWIWVCSGSITGEW